MPTPTNGNDRLTYGDENDEVYALDGKDIVHGGAGGDILHGGAGDDRLYADIGVQPPLTDHWDILYGDEGKDILYGGTGYAELFGGTGNDIIHAGTAGQDLYGEDGNDKLYGSSVGDSLYGGTGKDLMDAGAGNDWLEGGEGHDKLYGNEGRDIMFGGEGNDRLYGGEDSDYLEGNAGKDVLDGGEGVDYAYFHGSRADYRITTNAEGVTTVEDLRSNGGMDGTDRLVNVERLSFNDGQLVLRNDDADSRFAGANALTPEDFEDGHFSTTTQFEYRDDVDIWSIVLQSGQTVTGRVSTDYEYPEPRITLWGPAGELLETESVWDDGEITFTAEAAGTYYFATSVRRNEPIDDPDLANGPHYTNTGRDPGADYVFSLDI
jgi:Ca2+-binding RTX toxin-like protein